MEKNGSIMGLSAIALGLVGFAFRDYALQWQHMPAGGSFHDIGAMASAALLVLAGAAVLWRRTAYGGAQVLTTFFSLWALVHLPDLFAAPADVSRWLGVAEPTALSMGALTVAMMAIPDSDPWVRAAARLVFGACCVVFGLSHFQYAAITAGMIPAWIPFPLFWAYATGLGHLAAGLALLSGIQARLAALCLAGMFAAFVLALHLPRIVGSPGSHIEWVMGGIALSMTGAAFALWRSLAPQPVVETPAAEPA